MYLISNEINSNKVHDKYDRFYNNTNMIKFFFKWNEYFLNLNPNNIFF